MLRVEQINKTYENTPLLKDVSFSLNEGETVCLLGPSGSGKSTLLRIIAGIETPEQGKIFWNGEDITQTPTHLRHFNLMFQNFALFPHLNVYQNVAFGLRMQKLPQAEIAAKVEKALALINMQGLAQRKVTDLSGGEQQRVALARALAPNPRLLMLDEPLGALDRSLKEQLGLELRQILHETRIPVIYVTHDQQEAFTIADRLMILHNGSILQSGTPHHIYAHPINAWLASFLGLGTLLDVQKFDPLTHSVITSLGIFTINNETTLPDNPQDFQLLLRSADAQVTDNLSKSANSFIASVIDCRFRGDFYSLLLHTNSGLEIDIRASQPYPIGTSLKVTFPPETILLLLR